MSQQCWSNVRNIHGNFSSPGCMLRSSLGMAAVGMAPPPYCLRFPDLCVQQRDFTSIPVKTNTGINTKTLWCTNYSFCPFSDQEPRPWTLNGQTLIELGPIFWSRNCYSWGFAATKGKSTDLYQNCLRGKLQ